MDIHKGLAGIIADTSKVSEVVPETSTLAYRGYSVEELCEKTTFEEVCCLLLYGNLPSKRELAEFTEKERAARVFSKKLQATLETLPTDCHPMDSLRAFVSLVGLEDARLKQDSGAFELDMAIRLLGCVPVYVAWDICRREGRKLTEPDLSLSMSENFFKMIFGKVQDPAIVKAFDVSLILYAEHSFNASTFTSRVITSTGSDYYSAVTGAIGALKGPLHGGANEAVMKMFRKIGDPREAETWIMRALQSKERIMGFGHRVYRTGDSRVPTMKKHFLNVAAVKGNTALVEMYEMVANVVMREKNIHPNLDYPSAPAYFLMGFAIDFFTPIFVMSRIAGWSAHIIEQRSDNRLIRPICLYTGEQNREILPLNVR